ncbi:phosphoribosylformylglycinamidine synthase subunit PurS [Salinibacillus xinjiangensis]|uniref:Phosphoribosylformylglycinamidine synthase subunit PurS n=1 Tax=Salinibacillus xinjiangensis TaxID=1229268 RepID=A0A6G1XAT7_9BACI|nr:phosphoribosylformylglycinamidine synthase subunit PurS [Salinibacillus xinjiangensis]MRG88052.1 phosphoribosylformylglycinamidine synthase subunit PurS [Salinibacillus xinjiangensis]
MFKVKVYVTLKQGVLDPQGKAVKGALHSMDFQLVEEVRIGKYMELTVDHTENVEAQIEDMCKRLLANPVMEEYSYEIEEVVGQ